MTNEQHTRHIIQMFTDTPVLLMNCTSFFSFHIQNCAMHTELASSYAVACAPFDDSNTYLQIQIDFGDWAYTDSCWIDYWIIGLLTNECG